MKGYHEVASFAFDPLKDNLSNPERLPNGWKPFAAMRDDLGHPYVIARRWVRAE